MVCAGLDTILRCLLYRDEVPTSEWILFSHQLVPLARVTSAFFVAVSVRVAMWHYYGLCWVRHHPPVLTVSWWGPHQWVNPLQPSVTSAGQSLFSFLIFAVPVGAAIWHYYCLCRVRHRPPVLIVSWWGSLQWVNPLQPSVTSAGQSFFSFLIFCCSSRGCNMELLRFALGLTPSSGAYCIMMRFPPVSESSSAIN
jgi:hypothetical protein